MEEDSIHLTWLFENIFHTHCPTHPLDEDDGDYSCPLYLMCPDRLELRDKIYREAWRILEEKQESAFSNLQVPHFFSEPPGTGKRPNESHTLERLHRAAHFHFDDQTLDWIFRIKRHLQIESRKLVETLVEANIIPIENAYDRFSERNASRALSRELSIASNDEIQWYLDLGLKPGWQNLDYTNYVHGFYTDLHFKDHQTKRSFKQIIMMFNLFYHQYQLTPSSDIFFDCYSLFQDETEKKIFLLWIWQKSA
ncbi:MAG: hypothetical protein Satyrvirus5_14 [Satyrvirus sp.]|uniref:Uncharacterized protein n=1 Tax=Satyrvirus sp. TaxID=2487771 RepID=A0A3G5AIB2_9VIRU|nr:MAG: hypothetical protein Satyrvirus5_14 [Satyrvirus sp.]